MRQTLFVIFTLLLLGGCNNQSDSSAFNGSEKTSNLQNSSASDTATHSASSSETLAQNSSDSGDVLPQLDNNPNQVLTQHSSSVVTSFSSTSTPNTTTYEPDILPKPYFEELP